MENKLIIPHSKSSLGFYGIIKESINTTRRNGKLLVPILALVFLSFSQLDFAHRYFLAPVTKDLLSQLAKHPHMVQEFPYSMDQTTYVGAFNDLREILVVTLVTMTISSLISLVFFIATVSSSSEAYTAKALGVKDVLLKIKKSWKRPIVTTFYMILLTLGIALFYMISFGITSILAAGNSWVVLIIGAITLSIPFCYFYVATLWIVSLVVCVLEDGVSGVKAIGRAGELMKGRRVKASLMMVVYTMAYGLIVLMAKFLRRYCMGLGLEVVISVPFRNGLYCLLEVFMYVVYTVFYHEWKASDDEKELGNGFYLPIANGEV